MNTEEGSDLGDAEQSVVVHAAQDTGGTMYLIYDELLAELPLPEAHEDHRAPPTLDMWTALCRDCLHLWSQHRADEPSDTYGCLGIECYCSETEGVPNEELTEES